jgi:hypothetical protein
LLGAASAWQLPPLLTYAVNVTNTGRLDSDDVVIGFIVPPGAGANGTALQELAGFQRVHVPAGATVTAWIGVPATAMMELTGEGGGQWAPRLGRYTLRIGAEHHAMPTPTTTVFDVVK